MQVSPWAAGAVLESPDGSKTARLEDGQEIAMGGPTSGRLVLSTGFHLVGCNPSMVWSDDSRYLAVPRWRHDRSQCLVIIDTETGEARVPPRTFRVLQLSAFRDGIVEGVDSPAHMPVQVRFDVSRFA